MNVVLLTWIGIGGFTAALMGPLVLGCIWRGVTPAGAIFGFWFGAILFVLIHTQILSSLIYLGDWFKFYSDSPYSAATISGLLAVIVTIFISLFTKLNKRNAPISLYGLAASPWQKTGQRSGGWWKLPTSVTIVDHAANGRRCTTNVLKRKIHRPTGWKAIFAAVGP